MLQGSSNPQTLYTILATITTYTYTSSKQEIHSPGLERNVIFIHGGKEIKAEKMRWC